MTTFTFLHYSKTKSWISKEIYEIIEKILHKNFLISEKLCNKMQFTQYAIKYKRMDVSVLLTCNLKIREGEIVK